MAGNNRNTAATRDQLARAQAEASVAAHVLGSIYDAAKEFEGGGNADGLISVIRYAAMQGVEHAEEAVAILDKLGKTGTPEVSHG